MMLYREGKVWTGKGGANGEAPLTRGLERFKGEGGRGINILRVLARTLWRLCVRKIRLVEDEKAELSL